MVLQIYYFVDVKYKPKGSLLCNIIQTSAGLAQHSTLHNCLKMNIFKENYNAQFQSLNKVQKYPIYWFDNSILILKIQDIKFWVHHSLF